MTTEKRKEEKQQEFPAEAVNAALKEWEEKSPPIPKEIGSGLADELQAAAAMAAKQETRKFVAAHCRAASALVKGNMSSPVTRVAYSIEHETPVLSEVLTGLRGYGYIKDAISLGKDIKSGVDFVLNFFRPIG